MLKVIHLISLSIKDLWTNSLDKYIKSPKNLIIDSKSKTKAIGSSTCCIITLERYEPILNTSYIGDSGYLIIRRLEDELKVIYVSPEHTRDFNFPY